jgi:hypothetical protein
MKSRILIFFILKKAEWYDRFRANLFCKDIMKQFLNHLRKASLEYFENFKFFFHVLIQLIIIKHILWYQEGCDITIRQKPWSVSMLLMVSPGK